VAKDVKPVGRFFNVSFPVGIGGVLGAIVIALTYLHFKYPDYRPDIVFFSLAVTAAATLGSAFYIGHTLRAQIENEQKRQEQLPKELAISYLNRWNTPEFFYTRKTYGVVFDKFRQSGAAAVKTYLLDPANAGEASNVGHILNFWEEMAIAIHRGLADEELIFSAYRGTVVRSFNALSDWVEEERRLKGTQKLWEEAEQLYNIWKTK
jgi:hypothetical protein